jgi:radical SAM superfamily enzyme YgiQ (UPF0313 family)
MKIIDGLPLAAPYGLRKIEAQLLVEGFDVLTVDSAHLTDYLENSKVLGIHVMDPFGLGPASTTFASILREEPFTAQHFRNLMERPEIASAKKHGLKIIIGGPGVWQFKHKQKFVIEHGIDCIVEGEAEKIIGKLMKTALNNNELPKHYQVELKELPNLEEIPDIQRPSVNGLIEIGRGCCRGCQFCSVALRPLRWYPYEKILREITVNKKGCINLTGLHAEDVLLYGSKNTIPNDKAIIKLHRLVTEKCETVYWSHCSIAAIAAKPALFRKTAELILQKQTFWGAEIGIETGSPELVKKVMPAKAHPFKVEEWPEIVHTSMGLMHDNNMIPACTLIVGLPQETEEDLIKTIALIDDLKSYRSLIVPLFFVPTGRFKDEDWFKRAKLNDLHQELLIKCMEHGFFWIDDIFDITFYKQRYGLFMRPFYRLFINIVKKKGRVTTARILKG